ncbi:MAG: O-methyltransferase [Clostridia bacterium]|nr:O-methyltransferase [Clostridia bacterium]
MEEYANKNDVPIIHKEMKAFLEVLCKVKKPDRILEIGSAIGYSASCMALACGNCCQITTIERDSDMTTLAINNFEKLGLSDQIRIIEGDAVEVLSCLTSKYDMIFIDAAKGYYNEFFEYAINLINDGGLIISDNVLYKGMTAEDSIVKRRQKTIVGRMREYLIMLCNHKKLTTSVIPIGDGVAVSIYNERGNDIE